MKVTMTRRARYLVLATTLACIVGDAHAQAIGSAANIEGVWKLAAPQTLLVPIDGRSIPFTKAGKRLFEAHKKAVARGDHGFDDVMTDCASPGQPRLMLTAEPFAIFQRERMVTILYKWNRVFRQINVGEPLEHPIFAEVWKVQSTGQGQNVAKWQGDTLVVNSKMFTAKLLDNLLPNSDDLELLEKIRLRDANTLEDRITITDPQMYSRSWETVLTYSRQSDDLLPFPEDVCLDRLKAKQIVWPK